MPRIRPAVAYCVHDDAYYLRQSIDAFAGVAPVFVFVSKLPWNDEPGDWEAAARVAESAGAEVVLMEHTEELAHREALRVWLAEHRYTHALIPDGDEIIEPELRDMLLSVAKAGIAEGVTVELDTYWKSPEYVIRPREAIQPQFLIDVRASRITGIRRYEGGRRLHLTATYGVVHHLSYVGPEERIQRKLRTWSHRPEVRPDWWEAVWRRWDEDKVMRDLHPTHPRAYGFAERIHVPPVLRSSYERWLELTGSPNRQPLPTAEATVAPVFTVAASEAAAATTAKRKSRAKKTKEPNRPRLSVVIPLHGGPEDIDRCLESLERCRGLVTEVVVVDDASPDDAPQVASKRDWVRVISNDGQRGFAAACNRGLTESTGELVLFLNSDTVVPLIGLQRLLEALQQAEDVAAAGPFTNRAGHGQQVPVTYTSLEKTLDLFAEDFSERGGEDVETDMITGFCFLVRRSVLDEVGPFDTRFGLGTFEDNDLCYRIRRAGYRLLRATRSFVHHHGHQSLTRCEIDLPGLLHQNQRIYLEKWRADLESGFASHLSGTGPDRIIFRREGADASDTVQPAPSRSRPPVALAESAEEFEAALRAGNWAGAEQYVEAMRRRDGCTEPWVSLSLRLVTATGGDGELFLRRALELNPEAAPPRLALCRLLLARGQEDQAIPHLQLLDDRGVAEAAFFLGVHAVRRGEPRDALSWMERALQLNPGHQQTLRQIIELRHQLGGGMSGSPS